MSVCPAFQSCEWYVHIGLVFSSLSLGRCSTSNTPLKHIPIRTSARRSRVLAPHIPSFQHTGPLSCLRASQWIKPTSSNLFIYSATTIMPNYNIWNLQLTAINTSRATYKVKNLSSNWNTTFKSFQIMIYVCIYKSTKRSDTIIPKILVRKYFPFNWKRGCFCFLFIWCRF